MEMPHYGTPGMTKETITKLERENYLIRLQKEFAFAGSTIPESVEVDGRKVAVRSYVFRVAGKKGHLTPAEQTDVDEKAACLRRKRKEIVASIASEDLTRDEAETLYRTAVGLDRALDTLYRIHEPKASVEEQSKKAKIEDGRRWLGLVRRIYSKENRGREGFQ
jgi:hypothetical protein